MNIKYKHGVTEQGKEMLVTQDVEEGTVSTSGGGSGWTLRRRGVYGVAFFSVFILIVLAVTGNSVNRSIASIYLDIFQPPGCSRKKSAGLIGEKSLQSNIFTEHEK